MTIIQQIRFHSDKGTIVTIIEPSSSVNGNYSIVSDMLGMIDDNNFQDAESAFRAIIRCVNEVKVSKITSTGEYISNEIIQEIVDNTVMRNVPIISE
ncbi:hypothetical protein [Vibrio gangliei]|uniref:hypothetical protein n=1 Tax=Vibrio gangliei TaxID=2077090 RepID=UPI000D021E50|nr:hypothetical protein [Vibrio gangliei]